MSDVRTEEKRIAVLLNQVAREVRPCKSCGEQIAIVMNMRSSKLIAYNLEGTDHSTTCPLAGGMTSGGKAGAKP